MKYVTLYPTRILDRIRYQLYGTLPVVIGEEIRFGPGDVKVISGDSCVMIPYGDVSSIVFEEGFTAACQQAESEAAQNAAVQFQNMIQPKTNPDEMPYQAPTNEPYEGTYN